MAAQLTEVSHESQQDEPQVKYVAVPKEQGSDRDIRLSGAEEGSGCLGWLTEHLRGQENLRRAPVRCAVGHEHQSWLGGDHLSQRAYMLQGRSLRGEEHEPELQVYCMRSPVWPAETALASFDSFQESH